MNKQKIAAGPGASSMILIAVMLSLCVLGALSMLSARGDDGLSARSTETVEEGYQLYARSEEARARLDAILAECRKTETDDEAYLAAVEEQLPEGMEMDGDEISWTETSGERRLHCALRVLPVAEAERAVWTRHVLTAGAEDEEELEDDWD